LFVKCGYYEVLSNLWLRNGQQVTIQSKTYASSTFSSSMHDADLFFLQVLRKFLLNKNTFSFFFFKVNFVLYGIEYIRRKFAYKVKN